MFGLKSITSLVSAFAAVFVLTTAASAQSGSQTIISSDDDGNTMVMQFTAPDYESLKTSDFTQRDVPLFTRILVLSSEQQIVVGSLIDDYLEAFRALTKELAVTAGPRAEFIPEGELLPDAAGGASASMAVDGGPMVEVNLDDLRDQLPADCSIGISIGVSSGSSVDGVEQPPTAEIEISLDAPDGEDISPEVQEKIRQRANEAVASIIRQYEERRAAEAAGEPLPPAPVIDSSTDFDRMKAEQAALQVKVEEFRRAKSRLRETFVANAQGTLAVDQLPRWPALERALTRDRSLPKGQLSGESVDLVKLVDAQKLSETEMQQLATVIEAYELELDSALRQRDAYLTDTDKKIDAFIAAHKPDQAIDIAERAAALRVAVRSANHRHAEQLASAMPAEQGVEFRAATQMAFYPSIPKQTRGQKLFASALKLEGLSPETVAAIDALESSYENELASLHQQLRAAIDREEPLQRKRSLENLKRSMNNEPMVEPNHEDPIQTLGGRRLALDDRYREQVTGLLTPEQVAVLPKPRSRNGPIVIKSGA